MLSATEQDMTMEVGRAVSNRDGNVLGVLGIDCESQFGSARYLEGGVHSERVGDFALR